MFKRSNHDNFLVGGDVGAGLYGTGCVMHRASLQARGNNEVRRHRLKLLLDFLELGSAGLSWVTN